MKPKVSFVIVTYNGDSYLAEAIDSVVRQNMKEIEILVVDDCSSDYTQDLMEENYIIEGKSKHYDPRIKYFRLEQNTGSPVEPRNYGNKKANADLICVHDYDDLSASWRAFFSYYYMKKNPQINCLTSAYWELNVDGEPVKEWIPEDMTRKLFESSSFQWAGATASYRKEDALKIPYRQVDGYTDDWVFLDDWTKAGMKFKTSNRVLANVRRLPWSVMQQRRAQQGLESSCIL